MCNHAQMASVARFDLAPVSPKAKLTPQGFLRIPAHFTRTGVFLYRRRDGTEIKELRPPEEVFHVDSISTLSAAPVVEGHPAEQWVSPTNAKQLAVGWTGDQAVQDEGRLSGDVIVMDAATIAKVGVDLKEISMGYRCRIDATPGTDPVHGPYDQVQRDIRYNHVALGPEGWGRAGKDIGLRLDAAMSWSENTTKTVKQDTNKEILLETITINGVDYEASKAAAQAYRADQARHDSVAKELDKLQGAHDVTIAKLKQAEQDLKEANDPKRLDSIVADRVELNAKAQKILGPDQKLPGSRREIMEAVLRKDNKDADYSGKSEDYVEGAFNQVSIPTEDKSSASMLEARKDAQDVKPPEDRHDAAAARQRMINYNQNVALAPVEG